MRRTFAFVAVLGLALGGLSAPSLAAPCKDTKGKFMKCPPPPAGVRCKTKDGKFAKCGAPGAMPMAK